MKEQSCAPLQQSGLMRTLPFLLLVGVSALGCGAQPPIAAATTSPVAAKPTPAVPAAEERYSLTAGSGRIVRSLKGPVLVDAYVMKGLPKLDEFAKDLAELLAAYERQGQGKFKFRLLEATTDALRAQAREAGLQEQPFSEVNAQDPNPSVAQGYTGLVFRYGSESAVIPALSPNSAAGLEFWITNKLREIRDRADGTKRRIGIVSGKDELKLSDTNLVGRQGSGSSPSIKSILEQAFPFYLLEEVDLKQGTSAIDSGLAGLIVTQPQKDYVERELRRIDEFLLLGDKSLVVFASAVNLKPNDPTLLATLSTRRLETLLDGYGLHMNRDAVFDHGAHLRIPVITQDGQTASLGHPGIARVVSDPTMREEERLLDIGFAGFFRMDEILFPFPSSLGLERDKQPADVQLQVVARSTAASSVEVSGVVDMKLREQWKPKQPLQQRILAAYAQGRLKSAFASNPVPDVLTPERAPRPSRVLVISSSEFITNPFAYAGNGAGASGGDAKLLMLAQPYTKYLTGTILVIKNTLDWMTGDEDVIAASAKILAPARTK